MILKEYQLDQEHSQHFQHQLIQMKNQSTPSAGALDAESPKSKKNTKQLVDHELSVFLWICNIFCKLEAVTISDGSRILPGPKASETTSTFLYFFTNCLVFRSRLGYGYTSRAGAISTNVRSTIVRENNGVRFLKLNNRRNDGRRCPLE